MASQRGQETKPRRTATPASARYHRATRVNPPMIWVVCQKKNTYKIGALASAVSSLAEASRFRTQAPPSVGVGEKTNVFSF